MDLLQHTPALTSGAASELARNLYGVDATATPLPGERDQNFLLETVRGERFVLKIANTADGRPLLEAQNAALRHLASSITLCPRVIADKNGVELSESLGSGSRHFIRLFTWLDGVTVGSRPYHSSALLEGLGRTIARLNNAFENFDHPAIHRDFYWDLANGFRVVAEHAPLIRDEMLRTTVAALVQRIEEQDAARFTRLRRCAVHNDLNDYNVLVGRPGPDAPAADQHVVGILDFGDIVHSFAIADLAIGAAYALLGQVNPLAAATAVVRGYSTLRLLSDDEIDALFGLILLRLCTSVALAAFQQAQRPDDPYLTISQTSIESTLPRLAQIPPRLAAAAFRAAAAEHAGFQAADHADRAGFQAADHADHAGFQAAEHADRAGSQAADHADCAGSQAADRADRAGFQAADRADHAGSQAADHADRAGSQAADHADHAGFQAADHADGAGSQAADHADRAGSQAADHADHAGFQAADHADGAGSQAADHADRAGSQAADHAEHAGSQAADYADHAGSQAAEHAEHAELRVQAWLADPGRSMAPVLGAPITTPFVVDLSVGSVLVSSDPRENDASSLTPRIERAIAAGGGSVGVGRYGEARAVYSSPLFASGDEDAERRTVHLGIDLFAPPGSAVHAPLDGTIHVAADNRAPLDYGPVVILRHQTADGDAFFTLYGHLSRASLDRMSVGQAVEAGQRFATLGTADENGGWPPHLHFQLILDLLDLGSDFPGVCRATERGVWTALSPDPNVILRIPGLTPADAAADKAVTRARRAVLTGGNLSIGYDDPVNVLRGWMQHVYDETGRRYLDAYNNVPHVGHCHPRVVRAASEQMRVLNTNTRYLHEHLTLYAERLAATLPEPLRVCYFVNSGSEANELALRLAHAHTRRRGVIVLEGAYHGNTTTLVSISPYKFNGRGGEGAPSWVRTVPVPDVYRGPVKGSTSAGSQYAAFVTSAIASFGAEDDRMSAFIAESAPSVAGQIILPDGYLAAVYAAVRNAGGVCIADEVQTGFGRLGYSFYAFEPQHVVPDIVVLGKPIGNGHPIGAVITTPAIARSFDNGMEFFSTFGGNSVSCAVGLAVLDVVHEEGLQEHAREVGQVLLDGLRQVGERHAIVGDVRGSGLFVGVELVTSRETIDPATAAAAFVTNRLREEGILIGTEGPFANILKIRPPMPFTRTDALRVCQTLDRVLRELQA